MLIPHLPKPVRSIYRLPTADEMIRRYELERTRLLSTAIWAEQFGWSWRPVPAKFGCALLMCKEGWNEEDRFHVSFGWNCTLTWIPRPPSVPKPCAERMALTMGLDAGYYLIAGGAIFSSHIQRDDITGRIYRTPHPCYECLEWLEVRMAPSAKMMTARPRWACDAIEFPEESHKSLVIEEPNYHKLVSYQHCEAG